ncbi:MAG: SPOR domain-containing protein [Treponema sp.]|jgi:hypothetical protein|nr:SPOR domain-containing protein [Treponema sp.]
MERKKLLMIAISIGSFLVGISGCVLLFLSSQVHSNVQDSYPTYTAFGEPDSQIVGRIESDNQRLEVTRNDGFTTIQIPEPFTAGVPLGSDLDTIVPSVQSTAQSNQPTTTVQPPSQSNQPTTIEYLYWVQVGSFSTQARAELVRANLKNVVSSEPTIEKIDINGTPYFRVRLGPYTNKGDADHWCETVRSIADFKGSLVWQVPRVASNK